MILTDGSTHARPALTEAARKLSHSHVLINTRLCSVCSEAGLWAPLCQSGCLRQGLLTETQAVIHVLKLLACGDEKEC